MYKFSTNFDGMFIVVSTLQNLLYCSLYQLTIYLHNVRSERFGMLAHGMNFAFLAANVRDIAFLSLLHTLKAMTTESKFGNISKFPFYPDETILYP